MSEAWHSIMTTDPLADSDEEPHDEHARRDYSEGSFLSFHVSKLTLLSTPPRNSTKIHRSDADPRLKNKGRNNALLYLFTSG